MLMLCAPDVHAGFGLPLGDEDGLVRVDRGGEGGFGYEARLGAEEGLHLGVVLPADCRFGCRGDAFEDGDEHGGGAKVDR